MPVPLINVLIPVKNEEWIIETFLKITSEFADHILLADQNSTDKTVEIASSFPKVTIIKNDSAVFNEASRQQLLIETARQMYGKGNVLLALDADEIIAYNALNSVEWNTIRSAKPGTILFFEKPTFYGGINDVIRYESVGGWPLGYVDDGTPHNPKYIHSKRIPYNEEAPRMYLKDIKFLHCNLLSLPRQRSKVRYYCLLESLAKSKPWYVRIVYYSRSYNYAKEEGDGLERADPNWTNNWLREKLANDQLQSDGYLWYDHESLKLFQRHGFQRFWFEDVWDINWEEARDYFGMTDLKIKRPPVVVSALRDFLSVSIKFTTPLMKVVKRVFDKLK